MVSRSRPHDPASQSIFRLEDSSLSGTGNRSSAVGGKAATVIATVHLKSIRKRPHQGVPLARRPEEETCEQPRSFSRWES